MNVANYVFFMLGVWSREYS